MRTLIFVFLFSLLTITPVNAMTGNKWLSKCGTTNDGFNGGVCLGYLHGIRDVNDVVNQMGFYSKIDDVYSPFPMFCLPLEVQLGQLKKIVIKWLNQHPEKLHERLDLQYIYIMREIFPCKN